SVPEPPFFPTRRSSDLEEPFVVGSKCQRPYRALVAVEGRSFRPVTRAPDRDGAIVSGRGEGPTIGGERQRPDRVDERPKRMLLRSEEHTSELQSRDNLV